MAGAPASIITELNSFMEEWATDANISSSGTAIVSTTQTNLVHQAVLTTCAGNVGFVLDFRACEKKLDLNRLLCAGTTTTGCLTAAQLAVFDKEYDGPETSIGQRLFPGGFSPWGRDGVAIRSVDHDGDGGSRGLHGQLASVPCSGAAALQCGNRQRDLYCGVLHGSGEARPLYDATDPNLSSFKNSGGKLLLWQGEADPMIPTNSSLAYYQAVVKAMGGARPNAVVRELLPPTRSGPLRRGCTRHVRWPQLGCSLGGDRPGTFGTHGIPVRVRWHVGWSTRRRSQTGRWTRGRSGPRLQSDSHVRSTSVQPGCKDDLTVPIPESSGLQGHRKCGRSVELQGAEKLVTDKGHPLAWTIRQSKNLV